jgi:hypothetical protein
MFLPQSDRPNFFTSHVGYFICSIIFT